MSTAWYRGTCIGVGLLLMLGSGTMLLGYQRQWDEERAALQAQVDACYEQEVAQLEQRILDARNAKPNVMPIIRRLKPSIDTVLLKEINEAIIKYSKMYDLPPELVVYVMKRESHFKPLAKSKVGAIGLMQVFPKWHKDKMEVMGITYDEVYEIDHNVRLGVWILSDYLDLHGTIDKALTRYVGGKHPSYVRDILVGFTHEMLRRTP